MSAALDDDDIDPANAALLRRLTKYRDFKVTNSADARDATRWVFRCLNRMVRCAFGGVAVVCGACRGRAHD